jgi:hypothetical protein
MPCIWRIDLYATFDEYTSRTTRDAECKKDVLKKYAYAKMKQVIVLLLIN